MRCGAARAHLGVVAGAPKTAPVLCQGVLAYPYCWAWVYAGAWWGGEGGRGRDVPLALLLTGFDLGLSTLQNPPPGARSIGWCRKQQ